ncbi:MAG: hypothetical protein WKG07_02310 [Hymenobacter sp.]
MGRDTRGGRVNQERIGYATAARRLAEGATVFITGRRSAELAMPPRSWANGPSAYRAT